jgi:hypothetical protein
MEFYIQNKDAGYLGNAIIFWALNNNGYTADLNKAQKFTREQAEIICLGNPKKNIAWRCDYIDNNLGIQRVIDAQYVDNFGITFFSEKSERVTD